MATSKTEARLYAQAQAIQALADELRRRHSWPSRLVDAIIADRVSRAIFSVFAGICMLLFAGAGYRLATGYPPSEIMTIIPRFTGVTDATNPATGTDDRPPSPAPGGTADAPSPASPAP